MYAFLTFQYEKLIIASIKLKIYRKLLGIFAAVGVEKSCAVVCVYPEQHGQYNLPYHIISDWIVHDTQPLLLSVDCVWLRHMAYCIRMNDISYELFIPVMYNNYCAHICHSGVIGICDVSMREKSKEKKNYYNHSTFEWGCYFSISILC